MSYGKRYWVLLVIMLMTSLGIVWRLVDLNILERSFLLEQSNARIRRVVSTPAHRGMITDRHGKPLAISAQVNTVWVQPKEFLAEPGNVAIVAKMLGQEPKPFLNNVSRNIKKHFVYLNRSIPPELGVQLKELDIPGLHVENSYKRFYPEAEVMAHLIGFTNIDNEGKEGIELAYNDHLRGIEGKKEVVKDRRGHIIGVLNSINEPEEGHDLTLSIDSGVQYLAYRTLQETVQKYQAKSGSIVVMDVHTGEILAMVNQPSYNPNHIVRAGDGRLRNRAMTDQFEPGSTIKAVSMAAILKSGQYKPTDVINTEPGWMNVEGYIVKDVHNHGKLTVSEVLQKSSNVGFAIMSLQIPSELMWQTFHDLGFGERSYSGFPGEAAGSLVHEMTWRPTDVTSMSRGYGMAVTTVQLAHAYATIANHGVYNPVSLLKQDDPARGEVKLPADICETITTMLESVTQRGGTGTRARVRGYRVAGKTGTAYIAGPKGYDKAHYMSSFVGFAPVSQPKLAIAVVVKEPKRAHFGGIVAAPAFAKVMSGALRLLAVTPDNLDNHAKK